MMLRICAAILLATALISCKSKEEKSDVTMLPVKVTPALKVTWDEFSNIISGGPQILPLADGKSSLMMAQMPSDTYRKIYQLDHETKKMTLVHDAKQPIAYSVSVSPDHKNLYFYLDSDGDEQYQIYALDAVTKKIEKVFGYPGFKSTIEQVSSDSKTLFIRSNYENKAFYSIYVFDLNTKQSRKLNTGDVQVDGLVASEDGQWLALNKYHGNNEAHLYLYNLKTDKMEKLFQEKGELFAAAFFTNTDLYINSSFKKDRAGCAKVSLKSPKNMVWFKNSMTKDYSCGKFQNANYTFVQESFDGKVEYSLHNGIFGKKLNVKFPKPSMIGGIELAPQLNKAFVLVNASQVPSEFYEFPLVGKELPLTKISHFNRSKFGEKDFGASYDLFYKSFDGKRIHAIYYMKEEWKKDGKKHPVILWPHGGPDSQEMHRYHRLFQFMILNGYAVLAPNFRGSTGYGKKFETLNDEDWGGGHIKDLIWAKRAFAKQGFVDKNNFFIFGGSFGGFSTLSAITQYSNEFKAAVPFIAIGNLFTFMKSIPPDPAWQGEFLTEVGDPVKDEKLYRERSPFFNVSGIKLPLLIYQAENDIRTVKAEMDSFVAELKKNNIPVEYVVLKDVGHGLERKESQVQTFEGAINFFNKHL